MFSLKILTPKTSPVARLGKEGPELIKKVLYAQMLVAQSEAKKNVTGGGKSKDRLNVRSGRLRNSITTKMVSRGNEHAGIIGSNVIYARIHEEGGEIKPVNVKYLTIPLPAAKTKAGVARGGARSYDDTFVKKSKAGNLIIFQKQGKQIVPLFLLRDRPIEIPERPYLMPALEAIKPRVVQEISERFAEGAESVHGR